MDEFEDRCRKLMDLKTHKVLRTHEIIVDIVNRLVEMVTCDFGRTLDVRFCLF